MTLHRITAVAALVAIATLAVAVPAGAETATSRGPLGAEKKTTFYVVAAHPDDELAGWSYLEQLPNDTYTVFVIMTHGEGTNSCLSAEDAHNIAGTDVLAPTGLGTFPGRLTNEEFPTATNEDSSGPYKYEGPGSQVGEPDKSERHPLGFPWVGQGSAACKEARVASWHWFLDGQFRNDGIGTDLEIADDPKRDDDYRGTFCPAGHQGRGAGQPVEKQIGCAEVWADEQGARIAFDLGDQGYLDGEFMPSRFTPEQVTAAIQAIRSHRAEWGLTVLPEAGVMSTSFYGDGTSCERANGSDHDVVNQAIRHHDQGLPLRAGIMGCETDDLGNDATTRQIVQSPSSLVLWSLMNPVTGERIGTALVNYGWLFPDYVFQGCDVCNYWEVREEVMGS